ncbi:MAG: helix-turn-helix transcriptional regulator [Clostridiaceae bacterium]|nr:helix-turn-helix transcriptional regulator [Clostridiaceae bacterium]
MNFSGDKLLLAMANGCMTVGDLAKQAEISRVGLTSYISGKRNPKPATIGKIAKALNVKVEDLIEN